MEKVIAFVAVVAMVVGAWFGVMWCLWSLWGWVLPQVWASGPAKILAPSFWLFAAYWTIMVMVGRGIFGSRSE